jgi:hypothetical protein
MLNHCTTCSSMLYLQGQILHFSSLLYRVPLLMSNRRAASCMFQIGFSHKTDKRIPQKERLTATLAISPKQEESRWRNFFTAIAFVLRNNDAKLWCLRGDFILAGHNRERDKGITLQFLYKINTSCNGFFFERYYRNTLRKGLFAPCNASQIVQLFVQTTAK